MKKIFTFLILAIVLLSCSEKKATETIRTPAITEPYLVVLGIAQDAGFPQINCYKDCCKNLWNDKSQRKMVSCLGLVNPIAQKSYLFDATPDFKDQLDILQKKHDSNLDGIFLTHAHIGHYTGLMHLGREAMGAKKVPVYAMPRMKNMLEKNAPWSQLVSLENIDIQAMQKDSSIILAELPPPANSDAIGALEVTPFLVPHRDEFSETVGYYISGRKKSAIFIPDIDKWEKWDSDILDFIRKVDYAFLDGSFFQNGEIPGRDMNQIPHPFMEESMKIFKDLSSEDKAKIHFIHFNHTNPVLQKNSAARKQVEAQGFKIAEEGQVVVL